MKTRYLIIKLSKLLANKKTIILILCLIIVLMVVSDNVPSSRSKNASNDLDKDILKVDQDDPDLILYLKNNMVHKPSDLPYNLTKKDNKDPSQHGQGNFLINFFKNKTGGTFIEAGALDGEWFSNTLHLERNYGWTGLLVEPDPINFKNLNSKNRKSSIIECCISPTTTPISVLFSTLEKGLGSRIANVVSKNKVKDTQFSNVTCIPLYSLMLAMELTTLDFLAIDLEGIEVKVLESLPWDKVDIKTILVESIWVPEGREYLRKLIEEKNYKYVKKLKNDYFFSKEL